MKHELEDISLKVFSVGEVYFYFVRSTRFVTSLQKNLFLFTAIVSAKAEEVKKSNDSSDSDKDKSKKPPHKKDSTSSSSEDEELKPTEVVSVTTEVNVAAHQQSCRQADPWRNTICSKGRKWDCGWHLDNRRDE